MTRSTENVTGGCPFTKKTSTGCPFTKKYATPCPMINTLMKMCLLDPKKEWSTQDVQDALKKLKMTNFTSWLLTTSTSNALKSKNLPFSAKNLQKHNLIEHDSSMSREDDNLGDHIHFNKKRFDLIKKYFQEQKYITLKEFTEYRYHLYKKSLKENPNFTFGVNQYFAVGAETCAIFILLSEDDKLSLKKLRHVFEKEKLDDIKTNVIDTPSFVSSMIKFNLYWMNAAIFIK